MALVESSLLYVSLPSLSVPHFLAPAIVQAAQRTRNQLLIVLLADLFDPAHAVSHWNDVQRLLTFVYVQATKVAQDMGRLLMQIDVLLLAPNEPFPDAVVAPHLVFCVEDDPSPLPALFASIPQEMLSRGPSPPRAPVPAAPLPAPSPQPAPTRFPVVAIGGTFDHLHAGHKILLSMAARLTSRKLIVGVTDDALLTRKAHAAALESLSVRMANVRRFMAIFSPGLEADVVPINDVYGPTGWDADIQGLVVSKETADGAVAIASHRAAHDLPALKTFTIDVISATETNLSDADASLLKQTKMSSTYIREWILANGK
ncbi:hypothetical protein C8F04DRAFT_1062255 [Mycena alexandri]|uniref:Cytidyltransferase-like domain-containing protein n=1 Tax=Mycena alexandri TaxID=1745969 RepID=A0AAD6TNB0_9AGAR|nr:hypothetical protein C8F04DRAFT_1062255 [Mycena alexandri]